MSAWISLEEVARRLTVSRRTVERLRKAGRIRTIAPSPGRVAVTTAELDAYMASIERRGAA